MKIRINGDTVDTEQIHKISRIYDNANFDQRGMSFQIYNYGFKIEFFDKKDIKIILNVVDVGDTASYSDYLKKTAKERQELEINVKNKITEFRNQIETIWSNNQSNIPEFNLY